MARAVSHPFMGGGGGGWERVAGIIHPGHLQAGLAVILMNFITLRVRWYTRTTPECSQYKKPHLDTLQKCDFPVLKKFFLYKVTDFFFIFLTIINIILNEPHPSSSEHTINLPERRRCYYYLVAEFFVVLLTCI
jgi:hypothetical protein